MSAVRDNSQKTTFIYSNFYHLYRKSKLEAQSKKELAKGVVLKSNSFTETPAPAQVTVASPNSEELSSWTHFEMESAKREITRHLRVLRESKKRLKFLMQEMDELLKRS